MRVTVNPSSDSNECLLNQPRRGQLTLTTPRKALPGGQALQIRMTLGPGVGTYSAVLPLESGSTPVRVERLAQGSGGGTTGTWIATSGTVRVDSIDVVNSRSIVSGSVDAKLALSDGSQPITLVGTWACVI